MILMFLFVRRNSLTAFERCCGALPAIITAFPKCLCSSLRYVTKVEALNLSYVRKNCLPSKASDPYMVTFLWLPVVLAHDLPDVRDVKLGAGLRPYVLLQLRGGDSGACHICDHPVHDVSRNSSGPSASGKAAPWAGRDRPGGRFAAPAQVRGGSAPPLAPPPRLAKIQYWHPPSGASTTSFRVTRSPGYRGIPSGNCAPLFRIRGQCRPISAPAPSRTAKPVFGPAGSGADMVKMSRIAPNTPQIFKKNRRTNPNWTEPDAIPAHDIDGFGYP